VRTFVGLRHSCSPSSTASTGAAAKSQVAARGARQRFGLASIATPCPLGPNTARCTMRAQRVASTCLVGASDHGPFTPIRTYSEDEARDAVLLDEPDPTTDLTAPSTMS